MVRDFYTLYYERMMTGQPKSNDMVERGARPQLQNVGGHHDLETDLRNKSGKAVITRTCG